MYDRILRASLPLLAVLSFVVAAGAVVPKSSHARPKDPGQQLKGCRLPHPVSDYTLASGGYVHRTLNGHVLNYVCTDGTYCVYDETENNKLIGCWYSPARTVDGRRPDRRSRQDTAGAAHSR